ncbi:ATP-grasp domain-containing protein [Ileibacterium valens]|uniref:Carbamoylphosphate synthase large subunit n=1 Tax=Ileibacterium valens TaxID=1862668 RepID=A0A1U7NDR6_9FIRM|nr:ATP-grasp domain-containing protein [Ileibacterium valens]OLU37470.1 carbamoylphosphate synthase large subunit [Ileibacterium valens]OLU39260.1 carbamoylphosphate synthase large subunit [Erysipelotrichaceae bacterium NYU-BL-E8]OLU42297.1 carbamoylphosphate synthase large subunit [Erysipelotrichaceae bacterium NYU-BL-F16]
MVNFVFISPNYPENYWMFARGLKKNGARVLCVIDTPYESLRPELRENMDECYKVSSFNNYDEVFKAVAYFSYKYGKIDWIESNNEAWLELDARLRDDFNVKTGFSQEKIIEFQSKSAMKAYYEKAGLKTTPYCLPQTLDEALGFGNRVGYSLVLKPDHGVGASFTYHIHDENELRHYWNEAKNLGAQMILEKYVEGDIVTLDGVADSAGKIRFLGSMEYVSNCMDSVQNHDSIGSYYTLELPQEYREIAQRVVDSFGIKNRFFHGEYFRLKKDTEGLGKQGDLVGLEVNFRTPGGFAPDLINYTYDVDIYDIWANVLLNQTNDKEDKAKYSAGFVGRRNGNEYAYSVDEIMEKYKVEIIGLEKLPPAFASAMGDVTIKARFTSPERRQSFYEDSFKRKA